MFIVPLITCFVLKPNPPEQQQNILKDPVHANDTNRRIEIPAAKPQPMEIAEMSEPGRCMGEHKSPIDSSGIGHQWMIPQRLQNVTVKQADTCPGAAASGTVEAEILIQHTGRQGNMWQEYIVKQYPCHKAYSQENTSQIK